LTNWPVAQGDSQQPIICTITLFGLWAGPRLVAAQLGKYTGRPTGPTSQVPQAPGWQLASWLAGGCSGPFAAASPGPIC